MYNYNKAVKEDVLEAIRDFDSTEFTDKESFAEYLYDQLWTWDSVTGNGSGSYTFCRNTAKEYVLENMSLFMEAAAEFCMDSKQLGEWFVDERYEDMDITIRCYLLYNAIFSALDELEDTLVYSDN